MINCEQAKNLFDPYLNDELSSALVTELDAHRLECDVCRHQLTLMEACGNVVRLDTNEPRVSEDFTDRLMAILEDEQSPRRYLQIDRRLKVVGGLLGVAAAIALLVTLYPIISDSDVRVAGEQIQPQELTPVPAANLITGLPIDLLFNVTERFSSSIELGRYGINHISGPSGNPEDALPGEYPDFQLLPSHREPELDVIELLPDLDDGGELL